MKLAIFDTPAPEKEREVCLKLENVGGSIYAKLVDPQGASIPSGNILRFDVKGGKIAVFRCFQVNKTVVNTDEAGQPLIT